ncbi:hypothetical protein [Novosphingobium sp.]|uniref:hypothetical protein n=1 Tax=Novosphingobium sp. TaxID=1874826 RepID=UPI002633CCA6|nr:hypothetical protein [Novosphingobium sp.]
MNDQTGISEAIRSALALPLAGKIGGAFEHSPLLASAAALITTRIALRSMAGLLAVGLVAGSLLYMQQERAEDRELLRKAERKAKRKAARLVSSAAKAQPA